MLSYYCCWDFVIFPFIDDDALNELNKLIQAVDSNTLHLPERKISKGAMDNRGQMGVYFQSVRVEKE